MTKHHQLTGKMEVRSELLEHIKCDKGNSSTLTQPCFVTDVNLSFKTHSENFVSKASMMSVMVDLATAVVTVGNNKPVTDWKCLHVQAEKLWLCAQER